MTIERKAITEKKGDELLRDVRRALVKYDKKRVLSLLNEYLDAGFSPNEIVEKALMSPFHEVVERFRVEDIYFAEFLLVSDALNAVMNLLLPRIKASSRTKVKAIIGGWATSPEFAQEIGAEAWAKGALEGRIVY